MGFASSAGRNALAYQHKPTSVNRRALVVTADHGEAHTRPQGIERHRDTVLIVLESTKSLRLCFHGLADVGQPSADLPHFRVGAVSLSSFSYSAKMAAINKCMAWKS
jgi:hypothetical protein